MKRTDLIRFGGLAAMLAGVAFIFDELFVFTVFHGEWIMAVWIVGPLLMVVGLLGLHALQKDNYGRVGRGAFWVVVVASLLGVMGTVVPLQMSNVLYWPLYWWAAWAVPVGLIIYGVATLQAKVLPRWCGLGLILIPPIGMFYVGLLGLLWLALGYVLWLRRGTAAEQSARVR